MPHLVSRPSVVGFKPARVAIKPLAVVKGSNPVKPKLLEPRFPWMYNLAMNRQAPVQSVSSFDEFLKFEIQSQERHEFVDGNLFVMAGGTDRHDHVSNALRAHLFFAARTGAFRLHGSDMLIRTPDETGYYLDAFIVTDSSLDTPRVKRQPIIIIEVLSSSTESIDRGEKLRNYRTILSLEQYILLSQNEPLAEIYARQPNGIWQHEILEGNTDLHLSSIGFSLALPVLYENLPSE
jgi:Uma2 family endonuclease